MAKLSKKSERHDEDQAGASTELDMFQNDHRINGSPERNQTSDPLKVGGATEMIQMSHVLTSVPKIRGRQKLNKEEHNATNSAAGEADDDKRPLSPDPISWAPPANGEPIRPPFYNFMPTEPNNESPAAPAPAPESDPGSRLGLDHAGGSSIGWRSYGENPKKRKFS